MVCLFCWFLKIFLYKIKNLHDDMIRAKTGQMYVPTKKVESPGASLDY